MKRKLIVLAMHDTDVVVVTPRTLDRARGVLGDQVVATRDIAGQVGFGYLWDAVYPCFATTEPVPVKYTGHGCPACRMGLVTHDAADPQCLNHESHDSEAGRG